MLSCQHIRQDLRGVTLLYVTADGVTSFTPVPAALADKVTDDKFTLEYIKSTGFTHVRTEPMVQAAFLGDVYPRDFSAGISMKNAQTCYEFKFEGQTREDGEAFTEIVTTFRDAGGRVFEHHVKQYPFSEVIECFNVLRNEGTAEVTVEMLSAFSITGLSPFCAENDVDNIFIHRFKNAWSAEGKHEVFSAADLQMEDSWSSFGVRQERIGQVGSMPCRKHMPFYAVEDRTNECVWAVSMEAPASWQMDATHHQASISLTGGSADFNYGHNRRVLSPGGEMKTYSAFITAVKGDFLTACARLTAFYGKKIAPAESEESLPLIYNDYCCTWGNPSMETLRPLIDECAALGIGYFVTDVGWWRQDERSWYTFGDWVPGKKIFPRGIGELADYISSKGMKAGIWFEFEGVSVDSNLFSEHPEFLMRRDGYVIRHGERTLLDFRKQEVRDYLYTRVIKLLKENGFKYIKIDCNESVGIGADGADSYGAALAEHMEQVLNFFKRIREEIPDIVMEVCSSGGLRLEPKFLSLGSMASFSDAHLGPEGAPIAVDLHRYMHPRQMQIWATLLEEYSLERIYFTIAKGMLGRYCVSGDIVSLSAAKKTALRESLDFYRAIAPIIKEGDTLIISDGEVNSLRHIKGSQYLIRFSPDRDAAVLYYFSYGTGALEIREDILKDYGITREFGLNRAKKRGESIRIDAAAGEYCGGAILLGRDAK